MVVNNKQMIEWADQMSQGQKISLPHHLQRAERLRRFQQSIERAESLTEEELPEKIKVPRRKKDAAFDYCIFFDANEISA